MSGGKTSLSCKLSTKCNCIGVADAITNECSVCGIRDCPHDEPQHYHHDGCPACLYEDVNVLEGEA